MISIIIPAYKNTDLLMSSLKNNLKFFEGCEIIIVNDCPDETLSKPLLVFKDIKLIENKINLGFGGAVNCGVKKSKGDFVFILNNDVFLKNDNFKNVIEEFKKDPKLFSITLAQKEKNGRIVGGNKFFWKKGLFFHEGVEKNSREINGWAEGGSSIFDKKKFLELGGFDEIFTPFYWEDIDLSYRAWKKGYKILFYPDIVVDHFHQSTIGKYFNAGLIKKIAYRNQFIFILKNITEKKLLNEFWILIIPNLLIIFFKGEVNIFIGFYQALRTWSKIKKIRQNQKASFIKSDTEIIKLFNR